MTPTYQIENGPSAVPVAEYSNAIEWKFRDLRDSKPSEQQVQDFLERNPALVPGARTPGSPSGHAPIHNVLIAQPKLPGLRSKIPDFMWIATHSEAWYPTLIEIERPDKKIFKSRVVPRAEFTEAHNQFAQWRSWFSKPENTQVLIREYGVPEEIIRFRSMKLHMILVYGRRSEFENEPVISMQRSALFAGVDEQLMSYDRLRVDHCLGDAITVRALGSGQYEAVAIPPTFTLGPRFAERLSRISMLEAAIQLAEIAAARKEFLTRRLSYWRDWGGTKTNERHMW
ncbi:MAG: Shedu immune nuclease family protein [Pyrinomonadaceae bacterium]